MTDSGWKQTGSGWRVERREFLKLAGAAAAGGLSRGAGAETAGGLFVVLDGADPVASSGPVRRAAERLCSAAAAKGTTAHVVTDLKDAAGASDVVVAAGPKSELTKHFSHANEALTGAERVRLTPGQVEHAPAVLVSGSDARGFVYGLLELAERVEFGAEVKSALHLERAIEEKPANEWRSVGRYFCCELEDKPWYYDKEFWRGYLDALVASRFNRFCMAFGLEYDFPKGVTDDYFHLPYPYLVDVPGYADVQVVQLKTADGARLATPGVVSAEEKARNLAMLQFIAAETAVRGLDFQLGIWTHAYAWTDSPEAYHRIEGLTPETHAPYCRDALALLLKACPEIQGLTMRVHGESGVPEGSYDFWKTLFEAVKGCGRRVEIDMHAKGVDQTMIELAAETGMPVKLGAKFSAEHQSLGYQQADIRALETRGEESAAKGPFSVSSGSRPFTRYGYADYYAQGAPYKLWYRLWPGTQRHLLWCDPETAAAYGRAAHFCGAAGLDICEPLTFKGREGSGSPGGRCAYADTTLNPDEDWQKFALFYRVWGRKLYDPDADPETWRRAMRAEFGRGAEPVETALANASRMMPLVTSAHLASASNHAFWPELYTNMPVVLGSEKSPYGDTPEPKCFGTVSPLDPRLFSTVVEGTRDMMANWPNPKVSPVEVAAWLEEMATAAEAGLQEARVQADHPQSAEFRRIEEDVLIQIGLGRFFAKKLRSAVLWEIWQKSGDAGVGAQAVTYYKDARNAWATMATRAKGVYRADIGYGRVPMRRGCWMDRLTAIDVDLLAMQAAVGAKAGSGTLPAEMEQAVRQATGTPQQPSVAASHTPAENFTPGTPLDIALELGKGVAADEITVRMRYRHVDQAERWQWLEMDRSERTYKGTIPGDYTHSAFPLEYFFELKRGNEAWMAPGFDATLSNQPYYAVEQKQRGTGTGSRE
ncbi:MAG: hypothetical protein ACLGXA_13680 [Acidobacteriota bacterium]